MEPILQLTNVSKYFGATRALQDVGIEIYPGEIHSIIGENGAGKSTLGKILGGLIQPDQGEMYINGISRPFRTMQEARQAGIVMVFQELSLAPDLSVAENVALGVKQTRNPFGLVHRSEERIRCRATLATVGLEHMDLRQPVQNLPAGQQQLIEISKALARKPQLLILDEPSAMLSHAERERLHAIMHELRAGGCAIVFVTHHVAEVAAMSDRVTVLRNGRLMCSLAGRQSVETIVDHLGGKQTASSDSEAAQRTAHRPQNAQPMIEITVNKRDGGVAPIRLHPGEIVGMYGVLGCGRERIAKCVTGHARDPIVVNFSLDGAPTEVRSPDHARYLGFGHLPNGRAAHGILPSRSIQENLYLRPRSRGQSRRIFSVRTDPNPELRDLGVRYGHSDHLIISLSGGNQQKVLLGRLLGANLRFLVLEEPTAGIDIGAKADIHELLKHYTAKGLAILLISSDLEETVALSQRVHTMFDGQLVRTYDCPRMDDIPQISADVVGAETPSIMEYAS